jgi:hypothetical protein
MKARNIVVHAAGRSAEPPVEMCEHKGSGHPDTITDAVCEAVALELVRTYEQECGGPMHFNVDKGLLVGGRSEPRLGGGRVLERPGHQGSRRMARRESLARVRLVSAFLGGEARQRGPAPGHRRERNPR